MIYKISGGITLMLALLVLGAWNFHTTVRIERTFNASAADIWRVWNDAESIQKWWGPKGYTALVVRNDVREGGSYLWAMKSGQGRLFWSTGTYKEVVANKKIVSTMSFSNENGRTIPGSQVSVPGQWPNEITVIVEFSESDGKTRVTVAEVGVPLIAYALSKIGWAQQFDKIQSLLGRKATVFCQLPISRQCESIQPQAAADLDGNSHMQKTHSTQEKPHAQQLGLFFQDYMYRVFAVHIFAAEIPERGHVNARE